MERFLSTIFPCCFPNRRTSSSPSERTPLLTDPSHPYASSSRNSLSDVGDAGTATPGSVDARRLRKHNSVLPSPAYDAAVLRGIVDDFRSKLISVDSSSAGGEKGGSAGLINSTPAKVDSKEGINVTPVHTLNLSITSTTRSSTTTQPKLLDIWSPSSTPTSTPSSPPPSSTKLNYSAAAKRAPTSSVTAKKSKRPPPTKQQPPSLTLEQSTYQSLTNSISSKPIVHDWSLADDDTSS